MFRTVVWCTALLLFLAATATAQIDLTATGGTPAGAYPTLRAAFSAINAGVHTGQIVISVSGSTNETASAVLNGSGGTSSYTQITIRPAGGSARTIAGNLAGPLLDLNGADFITIDGLNTGGNALTIVNNDTSGGAGSGTGPSALRFANDATGNRILNLTLGGACGGTPTAQSGVVYFGAGSVTGNDDNWITDCEIGPAGSSLPVNTVYALGNSTSTERNNSGIVISGNRIRDFATATGGSTGITVLGGNSDWTISGNSFYQTGARTQLGGSGLTHYGIYVANGSADADDFVITDNAIGGSEPGATGSPWSESGAFQVGFTGIHLSQGGVGGSLQNNLITNFAWATNGDWRGIRIARGTVDVGTLAGNMIGSGSGTGAIALTGGQTSRTAFGIDAAGVSGSVTVSNNIIGSITTQGTATNIAVNIIGIQLEGNVVSVVGNTIGSPTTPNSLHAANPATANVPQSVTGIVSGNVPAVTIADNLVANLRNAYAGTTSGGQVRGIIVTLGSSQVVGNTVRELSGVAPLNAAGAGAAVVGIAQTSSVGDQEVSRNVIHSLSNTAASAIVNVVGIFYSGSVSGTHRIDGNIVHGLSLASTNPGSSLIGIQCTGGAATWQNNMVRLGLDSAGNAITTGYTIVGIVKATTQANLFYHNSVWIGGSGVGTSSSTTCAFRRAATGADDVRDNIFVNVRQNAATGGRHFAMMLNTPASMTSDFNIYQVAPGSPDLVSLDGGATSIGTLQALRGAPSYGQDANSGVGDPRFVAPMDPAATVSLKLQDPTAGEGSGVAIASVTDDQEAEARGDLTPADIGGDAGLYSMSPDTDIFTPHIVYAPLEDTASRGDRTLTVTLTDVAPVGAGVPSDGPLRPRVWYKKSADAVWTLSNAGTLESGDGRNGVWSFVIRTEDLLPEEGDEIQYYVVAQDQATASNLWYDPVAATDPVHLDVNTQLVPPSVPEHYMINGSLYGTYYVPNDPGGQGGRVYPSLTRAGGFFDALGGLSVSGDVTLVVNGDVLDEDGTHSLNPWQEVGAGGYTLTIRPDGPMARMLSGTTVGEGKPLIDIQGADRVAIDGRFAGDGRYLILRNTYVDAGSTGPTIRFDNGATHGVLRDCVVENNGTAIAWGSVTIGSNGINEDLQITGNDIRDATGGATGAPAYGVYASAPSSRGISIADNRVHNWTTAGLMLVAIGEGVVVQGNSLYQDSGASASSAQTAVFVGGVADGYSISGNFIGGQASLCGGSPWIIPGDVDFRGIELASTGSTTPSSIEDNTIRNIRMTGAGAASFTGIRVAGPSGPATVTGNRIGDDDDANRVEVAGAGATSGIQTEGETAAAISVTHNSIANLVATGAGAGVTLKGIYHAGGIGTISDNEIHDLTSASGSTDGGAMIALVGVFANLGNLPDAQTDNAVERNTVRALRSVPAGAAATLVCGIFAGDGAALARGRAERNRIYDLTNASTGSTPSIRGIRQASTGASWTLANNQIALTNEPLTNAVRLVGIYQDGPGACSYNSIYLGGVQATGDANSYAFGRYSVAGTLLRDNLFLNDRVSTEPATGHHCAIANLASVWDGWSSDNNVLIVDDPSRVGRFGSTYFDFTGWQAASGGEGRSLAEPAATISAASLFADAAAGDLDVRPTSGYDVPPIVSNAGIPISGLSTDFDGDARGSNPDIGADEITVGRTLSEPGDLPSASPTYPGNYDDLTVSGAGAPTLTGDVNIFGLLSLESGNVVTDAHTLTLMPGGSVSRSSGHIDGNLRKHVPSGSAVDCSFEVGTGVNYAPIDLHFDTVVTEGYLEATTVSGDQPELGSSTLDPAQSVNRYWRIGNEGVAFGTVDATLHFVPEDLDGGAETTEFQVGKYDAPDWTMPPVGSRTPTSIAATGLTSFSEFAVAELLGFTITASAGAGGSISPAGAVPVNYGGSQSFGITPDLGYHIADVLVDGSSVGAVATYDFTNVTADHTIEANFAIDAFTITASAGAGGSISPSGAVPVDYGGSQSFGITADLGYHIADVLVDGSSVGAVATYDFTNVTADHTIEASFAIDAFTITASAGSGGSIAPAGAVPVDYGGSQSFGITPDLGYHIADVLVNGSSVGAVATYDFTNVTADHTIEASFAIDIFTITASAGAGGSISPAGAVPVNYGGSQNFGIAPDLGYHIADVLVDGSSVGAVATYDFTNVTADHTIEASFTIDGFTITASAGPGGFISPSGAVPVNYGGSQSFGITPDLGYHIADVLVDGSSVGAVATYDFTNVTADHTIEASFAIDIFTITASAGAGGSISPAGAVPVNYGGSQNFGIAPDLGYHIADVLVDGSSVGAVATYDFTNVTADHTIEASFTIDGFTITASAGPGGFISPSGAVPVNYGGSQSFGITPDLGYHIADVLVDGSSVGAVATYDFTNVTADHTIEASFAIDIFTITASAGAGGSISPAGAVPVNYGGSQNFGIAPDLGYHIADVLVDGSSVGAVATYDFTNVTADHSIDASFAADTFTLATFVDGGGTLTIDPELPSYAYGDTVTVTANPDSARVFDHWTGDASGSDNPLLVIMNANKTITAVFVNGLRPNNVAVIAPNGGEVWGIGSTQTIRWTASDNVGVTGVELEYSIDGGVNFPFVIANDLPNNGSYLWVVPATAGQQARVRLTARDAAGNTTVDASDADFEISGSSQAIADNLLGEGDMIGVYPSPASFDNARVLFRLAVGLKADVLIFDLSGRLSRRLGAGIVGNGNIQSLAWDGRDDNGNRVAEGIYLVRVTGGSKAPLTKRLVLLQ